MPDVFSKSKRSEVMARIRSRGNRDTELVLARFFRAHGITGWRRHRPIRIATLGARNSGTPRMERTAFQVRPDFVFPKLRLALFVDGCFWHACPRHCRPPRGNGAFWRRKFAANQARDRLVNRSLRRARWRVVRIWEHALGARNETRLLRRIQNALAKPAGREGRAV